MSAARTIWRNDLNISNSGSVLVGYRPHGLVTAGVCRGVGASLSDGSDAVVATPTDARRGDSSPLQATVDSRMRRLPPIAPARIMARRSLRSGRIVNAGLGSGMPTVLPVSWGHTRAA